jgi:hypothetical protein
LARKKIIGSGFGCAGASCEPKIEASTAAIPAKPKRTVLAAILLAHVPQRIGMLWAVALPGDPITGTPAAALARRVHAPASPPMKVMNSRRRMYSILNYSILVRLSRKHIRGDAGNLGKIQSA